MILSLTDLTLTDYLAAKTKFYLRLYYAPILSTSSNQNSEYQKSLIIK